MSTKKVALFFSDLLDIFSVNSNESVPPSRAVQATLDAYNSGEVPRCDLYKSWAITLFQRYGPATIAEDDLCQLFKVFTSIIEELLNECKECINEIQNVKLVEFLNYSRQLFFWIKSNSIVHTTNQVTVFICFGLSVINSYLVVLSKQTDRTHTNNLLKKSLSILSVILDILSENPKIFCFDNNNGSVFTNLLSHLCIIGERTPKLDIKTAVDTWKCIIRLAIQNVNQTQFENTAWLMRPMLFLVKEIGRNVQTVYKQDSLSEPIEQIEKYLKVTNFYLRLLQKLTRDFRHVPFPVCGDFLDTLALLLTPPAYIVKTPVHKAVIENVTKEFRELIPFAYRNALLFKLLLGERFVDRGDEFYCIIFQIIAAAMHSKEPEVLDAQLLDAVFERLPKSAHIFVSVSKYKRLIATLSSLQYIFHLEHLEKALVRSVLQDDVVLALTSIDIWCTIFSVSNYSNRLSYFTFWKDINERFAKFADKLPVLYVEVLLKNLYMLLTTQEKDEIWNKIDLCDLTNDRFLLTIGLNAIPNSAVKQSATQHFLNELIRFLKESFNDMTVDNFYTIVKDIQLLTPIDFRNDELIGILLQYLETAMKSKKLTLLVQSILDFIGCKLEFINDGRILNILTELSMELSTFEDHTAKMCLVGFLRKISKISRLEEHSEKLLKIVDNDESTRHFGSVEGITSERVIPNESVLHEILKNGSVEKIEYTHICFIEEEMPVKKRTRNDFEPLLESLETNVDNLLSQAHLEQLSSSSVERIQKVIIKLQEFGGLN